jgi:hypothetical protein
MAMNNFEKESKLLKEYVRSVIKEDYDSSFYDSSYGGSGISGAGGKVGNSRTLAGAAFDPIMRVFKVAAGKAKEIGASLKQLGKISAEAIKSVSSGGEYEGQYKKIHNEFKRDISKITKEYGKAYAESWDVLNKSGVTTFAFLYNPALFVAKKAVVDHPRLALGAMAAMATGGWVGSALGGGMLKGVGAGLGAAGVLAGNKILNKDEKDSDEIDAKKLLSLRSGGGDEDKSLSNNIKPELRQHMQQIKSVINDHFRTVKEKLTKLKSIKTLKELGVPDDKIRELEESLKSLPEDQKKKKIDEIAEGIKQRIFANEIRALKQERDGILRSMLNAGVPESIIKEDGSVYDRYNKEISEIAKIFDIDVGND